MTHDQARDLAAGYVLGALERTEEAAVRDHLATCSEPHPEFDVLGGVVPALAELGQLELVEPPASLGSRIMAAAAADLAAHPRTAAPAAERTLAAPTGERTLAFPTAAERDDRTARRAQTRTSRFDWALRIAAVIAIVAVGAWGLNLQRQLDAAQRFDRAVASVVQAAGQPGASTVALAAATGAAANGVAAVQADGSVVLAMHDLAATGGNQVYAAWVIVGQNAPVAVGEFTVDSSGTAALTTRPATTPSGAVIALTLEPNAGNTAPKGSIVSSGVASGAPGQSN